MRALLIRSSASSRDENGGYTRRVDGRTMTVLARRQTEPALDPHR